jgi:hypothetical protein
MRIQLACLALALIAGCGIDDDISSSKNGFAADQCMGDDCPIKEQIADLRSAVQVNDSEIVIQTENRHTAEEMANDADEMRIETAVNIAQLKADKRDLWFKVGVNVAVLALEVGTAGYGTGIAMGCKTLVKAGRILTKLEKAKKITKAAVGVYTTTVVVKHGANDPQGELGWTTMVPILGTGVEIFEAGNELVSKQRMIAAAEAGIAGLEAKRVEGLQKAREAQARIETLEARNLELNRRINTLEALLATLHDGDCVQMPVWDFIDLELDPDFASIGEAWRDSEDSSVVPTTPETIRNCTERTTQAAGSYRTNNYYFYAEDKTFAADSAHTACVRSFESPLWRAEGCSRGTFQFDLGSCQYEQHGTYFSDKLTIARCNCKVRCCTGGKDLDCAPPVAQARVDAPMLPGP